jgi:hypothetical protein
MKTKFIIIAALALIGSSCTKTWTCEVSNPNVEAEPIVTEFKGTKEEMKAHEEKGTVSYGNTQIVTKCR